MKIDSISSANTNLKSLFLLLSLFIVKDVFCQNKIEIDFNAPISDATIFSQSYKKSEINEALIIIDNVPSGEELNFNLTSPDGPLQNKLTTINSGKSYDISSKKLIFNLKDLIETERKNYNFIIDYSGISPNQLFSGQPLSISISVKEERESSTLNESEMRQDAIDFYKTKYNPKRYFNSDLNIYLDKNIVHIFLDQNGNFIETSIPTTATEKYLYQFHIFYDKAQENNYTFTFTWEGKYEPQLNIERGGKDVAGLQSSNDKGSENSISEIVFEKIGPFTDDFKVKLVRKDSKSNTVELIPERTIPVAKLYHVSISTGLISTTLRNPQNIQTFVLPNGDSTLVADDPSLRGAVTLFATFYPKGRSFLLTPSGNLFDPSRFAVQVGAQLNNNLAENFFLGLSHDFARGGSFSYGAHFGRRNYVAGKPDFKFGSDKFDLEELVIKKEWNLGFYFGVVIDVRVAFQLLGSIGNPQF